MPKGTEWRGLTSEDIDLLQERLFDDIESILGKRSELAPELEKEFNITLNRWYDELPYADD
jgi:hypothetical protein